MALLEVRNLTMKFGSLVACNDVSFDVEKGSVVGLIGPNGAGKTTTMKTIAGLMHPFSGSIHFEGRDISRMKAHETIRLGVSYVPEGRRLFSKLTIQENLELGAFTKNDRREIGQSLEQVFELFPKLYDRRTQVAETMSGGEQQMVAIARGLMSSPRLLLLDELSLGLMPSLVEKVMEAVISINRTGVTVLLVEQMVQEALEIADRGYVIQTGKIVQQGTARELLDSPEVRKAYMGM